MSGERPAVLPFPGARGFDAARLLPSGRSLLLAFALLAAAAGLYALARETSMFAIERIEVHGLSRAQAAEVRSALAPLAGRSLVSLDGREVEQRLAGVPDVLSFTYDRAFPHTLRIYARPELPVAVLRRGRESWLVSARGRVVRSIPRGSASALARIWVPSSIEIAPGMTLDDASGGLASRAVGLVVATSFPARARTASLEHGNLVLVLGSGLELRLGSPDDVALKLAVARRILPTLDPSFSYLDVSVPERAVAGTNSRPSG